MGMSLENSKKYALYDNAILILFSGSVSANGTTPGGLRDHAHNSHQIQNSRRESEQRRAASIGPSMSLPNNFHPSSIYSWSIGHILEHEFLCLGHLGRSGTKEKKVDLSYSEQLLRVVFQLFV